VVNRGADESILFPTAHAKDAFIADLSEMAYGFAVEIHAYCVMETHYHLLARGVEQVLRRATAQLEADVPVPTDGARFRRMAVGRHLLQVTRYIHRNPVDAGLVGRPDEWEWSSYRGYLDPLDGLPWLRSSIVLGWLGSIGARQSYRRYCEGLGRRSFRLEIR
jgi:hypothetical protein